MGCKKSERQGHEAGQGLPRFGGIVGPLLPPAAPVLITCSPPCIAAAAGQGVALRNDIGARLADITRITTERYREHAAERKAKREVRRCNKTPWRLCGMGTRCLDNWMSKQPVWVTKLCGPC